MNSGFVRSFATLLFFSALWLATAVSQEKDTPDPSTEEKPKRVFRLNSKPMAPAEPESADSEKLQTGELPDGAVTVGIFDGISSLPEGLRDLAREATLAAAAMDWKTARGKYLQMLEEEPDNALVYANLGVAEHQLGNRTAAAANIRKSLELNPSIAQNWQTLGLIHFENGDLNLALSALMRAIHEAPEDGRNRLFLAAVAREYGWEETAIIELKRALQLDPGLADAHYNLALTYISMDPPKLELARRHYYSAIDLGADVSPELEKIFASPE